MGLEPLVAWDDVFRVFLGWRLDTSGRNSLAGNPRLGAWNRLTGESTPETLALYQDRG